MITDYLFLGPGGEILCTLQEIRRYVELHYADRHLCAACGCYLISSSDRRWSPYRLYRCANQICTTSRRTLRLWPRLTERPAPRPRHI